MSNGADNFYQSNKVTQQKVCRILRDVANFCPLAKPLLSLFSLPKYYCFPTPNSLRSLKIYFKK